MAVYDLSVWDLVKAGYHCGSLNVIGPHNLMGALLGGVALLFVSVALLEEVCHCGGKL